MRRLYIFSFLLFSMISPSIYAQQTNYDNWSDACNEAITNIEMTQCFYQQREIADSLLMDTYNQIMVILDSGLETAALESDQEMIEWYGEFKTQLTEGQKSWQEMTNANAGFAANLTKGGSMSNMTIHISVTNSSYDRLKVLEGFLEYLTL